MEDSSLDEVTLREKIDELAAAINRAGSWLRPVMWRAARSQEVRALLKERARLENQLAATRAAQGDGPFVLSSSTPHSDNPTYEETRLGASDNTKGPSPCVPTNPEYDQWLLNAARRGVSPAKIRQICEDCGFTPVDFEVLSGLERVRDSKGKIFFLLEDSASVADALRIAVMTYVFNAGTDYGSSTDPSNYRDKSGTELCYQEVPYGVEEIIRILLRQNANKWVTTRAIRMVLGKGGAMVSTPNGILMSVGGGRLAKLLCQRGGTTYGDVFMLRAPKVTDAKAVLLQRIRSGSTTYRDRATGSTKKLDFDRVLHHEEVHSMQYAERGVLRMARDYFGAELLGVFSKKHNPMEELAGAADGGYTLA